MSADNGIYIAKFPTGYRVVHATAIENLNHFYRGSREEYDEWISYFGNAFEFSTEDEAWEYAYNHAKEFYILEYGIQFIGECPPEPTE
jgi:hypothetical protein